MNKIDEKDKQLINLLISSPGLTQAQLGEKLGVTKLTVNNHIKRLKEQKVLLYTAPVLDLDKLGYGLTAIINIKIRNAKGKEAAAKLSTDPHVCSVYEISGAYDMLAITKFHDMKELDQWNNKLLQETETVDSVNTSVVFNASKENTNPNKIE